MFFLLILELKDSLTRYGADIKQKIMESLKSTWNTINDFARAHKSTAEDVVEKEVDNVLTEMTQRQEEQTCEYKYFCTTINI